MIERRIVIRYVKALLDVAVREGDLDRVGRELMQVQMVLRENKELREFFLHPRIPSSKKKRVAQDIFKGLLSTLVFHALCHIVDKKREEILPVIGDEFKESVDEARGIVKARIQTAVEISEERLNSLKERLEQFLDNRVELHVEVIPEILGGIILWIGSQIIDGSVRGRLERIRNQLLKLKIA